MIDLGGIFRHKTVTGVEVTLLPDGGLSFNCTQLSFRKKLIVVDARLAEAQSLGELHAVFDKNIPVCLSLNGRGILHRKITETGNDVRKSVLSVLPDAKADDFFFQEHHSGTSIFVSLIRKKLLHEVLEIFRNDGWSVISLILGPFSVGKLLPLIDLPARSLKLGAHNIKCEDNLITEYSYEKNNYGRELIKVDSELLEVNFLVAYASALQLLAGHTTELHVEEVDAAKNEVIHKRIFRSVAIGVLVFFLLALVVNFFLFMTYTGQHDRLSGSRMMYGDFNARLDSLSKKISQYQTFLQEAGWMQPSRISYYSDCIAESVPHTISLRELSVNPVQETSTRAEKKLVFDYGRITISGLCDRPTDLNPWIQEIRSMEWVNSAEIQNYSYDNKTRKGTFIISILINK